MTQIGDRAIYRPRVPHGRQPELFCFVVRIQDAEKDIVDLIAFPAGGEFQHINGVARKSETIQIHCWEPHEMPIDDSAHILRSVLDLEARVAAMEAKRPSGSQGRASDKVA